MATGTTPSPISLTVTANSATLTSSTLVTPALITSPITSLAASASSNFTFTSASAFPTSFSANTSYSILEPAILPGPLSPPTFGLQAAFDPVAGNSTNNLTSGLVIFENGCYIDEQTRDCSRACQSSKLMFSNTSTLHNCALYHTIAEFLLLDTSDDNSGKELKDLGFRADTLDPSKTIEQCFADYCNQSTSTCANQYTAFSQRPYIYAFYSDCGNRSLQNISCFINVCKNITSPANPDIGGQGVCTYYFLALEIA